MKTENILDNTDDRHNHNVKLIRNEKVRVVRGRIFRDIRNELFQGVKAGAIGRLKKDKLMPEVFLSSRLSPRGSTASNR